MQCNELFELAGRNSFRFEDFYAAGRKNGSLLCEAAVRKRLQKLLNAGDVVRAGRNVYFVPPHPLYSYQHDYSQLACAVAATIVERYPAAEFTVFEMVQLNVFLDHQLAHNVLFLSVEEALMDFIFDTLKERFPGRVMLDPSPELYHQYWYENMIVIDRLVTEAPKNRTVSWHTRLEKMLVDLLSNPVLAGNISENEIPAVFENAFSQYSVDESSLLRYAKRRSAEKRLRTLIRYKTNITLRTE